MEILVFELQVKGEGRNASVKKVGHEESEGSGFGRFVLFVHILPIYHCC